MSPLAVSPFVLSSAPLPSKSSTAAAYYGGRESLSLSRNRTNERRRGSEDGTKFRPRLADYYTATLRNA